MKPRWFGASGSAGPDHAEPGGAVVPGRGSDQPRRRPKSSGGPEYRHGDPGRGPREAIERPAREISFTSPCILVGGRPVLRDIALTLRPDELLAVCGPNGAGKTTLLRGLAGLLPGTPPRDPRRVAYLPQNARCAWALTVGQVAALGRIPHRDSAGAPVTRALQSCGILPLRDRRVDRISGGEARRAMLARAFATEPELLLLDEPTADLDPATAQAIMRVLRQTAESGRAVVVVQHAVDLALRYAHRIVVLQAGRIAADLPAREALPALASAFGLPFGVDPEPRLLPHDERDTPS